MFSWLRNRRRRKWLAEPKPSEWDGWLRENVWQYRYLDIAQQQRVQDFVCVLEHEKDWVGGSGFTITPEMRVTVAGQAALLTLGFGRQYYFDRLKTIILYGGAYRQTPASTKGLLLEGLVESNSFEGPMLGESWQGGPVVLAWNSVWRDGRSARRRRNIVLHEFAHHMDSLDGSTSGAPPMTSFAFERRWYQITDEEYERLLRFTQRGQPTLLDPYGATNHAEFFAVSTECFFTAPHEFSQRHAELYDVLVQFFGQDPRSWLPAHANLTR